MKLYSAWYCPFAQRAWMALEHKGIDFENVEVDPYDKSEWWLDVSRGSAMVPVIVQSDVGAEESTATDHAGYVDRLIEFYLPYSVGGGQSDVTSLRSVG